MPQQHRRRRAEVLAPSTFELFVALSAFFTASSQVLGQRVFTTARLASSNGGTLFSFGTSLEFLLRGVSRSIAGLE